MIPTMTRNSYPCPCKGTHLTCKFCHGVGELFISTINDRPPIPTRNYDWSAWIDGWEESSYLGYGATESTAVAELLEVISEEISED